jgi:bacillithiol system protein YtxJ
MLIIEIESDEQLQQMFGKSKEAPLWIFKHSTRCPISAGALAEFQAYSKTHSDDASLQLALVKVIENRPLSMKIAELTGIEHQSPQAILIRGGKAVWNESHWEITQATLAQALARQAPGAAKSHDER